MLVSTGILGYEPSMSNERALHRRAKQCRAQFFHQHTVNFYSSWNFTNNCMESLVYFRFASNLSSICICKITWLWKNCQWILNNYQEQRNKILFIDEAYLITDGMANKWNPHLWWKKILIRPEKEICTTVLALSCREPFGRIMCLENSFMFGVKCDSTMMESHCYIIVTIFY